MPNENENQTPSLSSLAAAGAAAVGNGALIGWAGSGPLTRSSLVAMLPRACLPVEWAPLAKSDTAQLGRVMQAHNCSGLIARRAKTPSLAKGQTRNYRVRWTVSLGAGEAHEIGEALGRVIVTVELRDDSSELHFEVLEGHAEAARIVDDIRADFARLLADEEYTAGDVTAWFSSILRHRSGAAKLGIGFYVPASGRAIAARLGEELSRVWGCNWIVPMLPVATGPELVAGLARGFMSEVEALTAEIIAARDEQGRVTPRAAASFLVRVAELRARLGSYGDILGAEVAEAPRAILAAHTADLERWANATAQRGAMLEIDDAPAVRVSREAEALAVAERRLGAQSFIVRDEQPFHAPAPKAEGPRFAADGGGIEMD